MKRAGREAGFSFTELMVVMVLIGILSVIVVPNFLKSLPEKRLKAAARNLYADMQRARLLAVKENKTVRVRFVDNTGEKNDFYYFDTDRVKDAGYGQWNLGEFRRDLASYGDVSYGSGSAGDGLGGGKCNWDKDECSQADYISFLYKGTARAKSVFLQNQNDDVCYAVTVSNFGNIKIRRFNGTGWDKK